MIIRGTKDVDAFYALFLGRLPENDLVRESKIGRDAFEVAAEIIDSEEFEKQVVDRARRDGSLPHQTLPPEHLPNVLGVIAECGLAPANEGATEVDWGSVLRRVLTAVPLRGKLETRYGQLGQQLIDVLPGAHPAELKLHGVAAREGDPAISSGVDIVASTVCRGWVIDRNDPQAVLHIKVTINGLTARITAADEFRRDVQDLYGGDGRVGFTVRLDALHNASSLSKASVEIIELSHGIVVLPEWVVEFGAGSAARSEAVIREELINLRHAIDRLEQSRRGSRIASTGR